MLKSVCENKDPESYVYYCKCKGPGYIRFWQSRGLKHTDPRLTITSFLSKAENRKVQKILKGRQKEMEKECQADTKVGRMYDKNTKSGVNPRVNSGISIGFG